MILANIDGKLVQLVPRSFAEQVVQICEDLLPDALRPDVPGQQYFDF